MRLIPGTAYGAEEYRVTMWGQPTTIADPRATAAERRTPAGEDGQFEFTGVPAGRYFVVTEVRWNSIGPFGLNREGGPVGSEIVVADGEMKTIVLTR